LQENVVGVGDVVRGADVQRVQTTRHLPKRAQASARKREIVNGRDRPAPHFLPKTDRTQGTNGRLLQLCGVVPGSFKALRTNPHSARKRQDNQESGSAPQPGPFARGRQNAAPQNQQNQKAAGCAYPSAARLGEQQGYTGDEGSDENGRQRQPRTEKRPPSQQERNKQRQIQKQRSGQLVGLNPGVTAGQLDHLCRQALENG